jgi:hypothetical protein
MRKNSTEGERREDDDVESGDVNRKQSEADDDGKLVDPDFDDLDRGLGATRVVEVPVRALAV